MKPLEQLPTEPDASVSDLAKITGLSEAAIYRLIAARKIRSYRIGRSIRIRREDVEALRAGGAA